MSMTLNRSTTRRGYTLIEMMVVVTIIAIVTATAMPHVDYSTYRQDMGAQAVRGALQQAQAYAVSSQHNVFVVIDGVKNRMFVIQDQADSLTYTPGYHSNAVPMPEGVKIGLGAAPLLPGGTGVSAGLAIATPTTVSAGALSPVSTGFVFRADGAVSSPAQIYLTSTRGLTKDARAIKVTQATGRVDWYRWNVTNSAWVLGGF
jgi:prepilin-type N-terminal cleavage/methylation domain-containing protein